MILSRHDLLTRRAVTSFPSCCYRNGRYDDIDYAEPPIPALAAEESAWAEALLKAAGKQ